MVVANARAENMGVEIHSVEMDLHRQHLPPGLLFHHRFHFSGNLPAQFFDPLRLAVACGFVNQVAPPRRAGHDHALHTFGRRLFPPLAAGAFRVGDFPMIPRFFLHPGIHAGNELVAIGCLQFARLPVAQEIQATA